MISRRLFLGSAASLALFSGGPARAAYEVNHSPADWRRILGQARFHILREAGTETPYTSPLLEEHRRGTFLCAGCQLPLFGSSAKYDSHTGWPSFWQALPNAIRTRRDLALILPRTEEHCRRCGGHLGHIFDDGPPPTGKRHCINGLALNFRPS